MVEKKLYYITRARIPSEKAHSFQIVKMCEAYAQLGFEVELVVPTRKNPILKSTFEYFSVASCFKLRYLKVPHLIISHPVGRILYWLESIFFIYRLLNFSIEKQDIIITRSFDVAIFYTFLKFRNVALELHDWPNSGLSVFTFLIKRIPNIIVTSEGLADELKKRNILSFVAPNGVDDSFFKQDEIRIQKKELGISENKVVVMYIGSLAAWKGVTTLLNASLELSKDFEVVILGGSTHEISELKSFYPSVVFVGPTPVSQMAQYQKLADILVVPNSKEDVVSAKYTSPIKLFGHLTSRVPIIASDIPSIRSIVNEEEVIFFDGSTTDLLKKIKHVTLASKEEIEVMTTKAFQKSLRFTWVKRAEKIINYLNNYD